jgi:hypothetical protein
MFWTLEIPFKTGFIVSTIDKIALAVYDRNVLSSIYGPIRDNNEWRIRYNYELYALYEYMDIITFV